jgi:glycosyltransferase involved in cell wall biosynthesis
MLVGVCDFPGAYDFPPVGYGGIERWLWATALGGRLAGADVHLLGPLWRREVGHDWTIRPIRLEDVEPGSLASKELRAVAYDLLIVGHEYPSKPAWRRVWEELDCDVATFQHAPSFVHQEGAFDGERSRLFCYSPEMAERYSKHQPVLELAVHLGLDEDDGDPTDGEDLIWVGRLDADKAPHLAAMAAGLLGRRIRFFGPVFDFAYMESHRELFSAAHVELVGEVGGADKGSAFRDGAVCVYTYARHYVEAGVATLGESLRAGTPVAALAWRPGTCADAALCDGAGTTAVVDPRIDDQQAAHELAGAIEQAARLRAADVREIGRQLFDPRRHFQRLATRP